MSGVKGAGGPPPKRSDQRRRKNKTAGEERAEKTTKIQTEQAEQPKAGSWSTGITQWYESLGESGQAAFYAASDWSSAWLMAEAMNAELAQEGAIKAATLAAWLKLNASLLATEGDRRRAAMELERPKSETADDTDKASPVTDIRSWKESLNA